MRITLGLFTILWLPLVSGCLIVPHTDLKDFTPSPSTQPTDSPPPFETPFNSQASPDDDKVPYLVYEIMSDGYRRLPVGTTGTAVDFNGQIVIWPNPRKILGATTPLWTREDVSVMKALRRLINAQHGYLNDALKGGVGTTTTAGSAVVRLQTEYGALRKAVSEDDALKSTSLTEIQFANGKDAASIASISTEVQNAISTVIRALNVVAKDKATKYTFTIKADLSTSAGKSTPVHVDGYDNIASAINVGKSDPTAQGGTGTTASTTPSTTPSPAPMPPGGFLSPSAIASDTSSDPQEAIIGVVNQKQDLAAFAQGIMNRAADPQQPAPPPPNNNTNTSTPTALLPALSAAVNAPDSSWQFSLASAPRGLIDLRATPADRGYILRIIPTLTTASTDGGTSPSSALPPPRGDAHDYSIDRSDYSLKLSGNLIFVNQIGAKNNSFATAPAAAISLHYRPRVELKVDGQKAFWGAWDTVDPAIGLGIAALNLNNAASTGKGGTSSGSSGVQVGTAAQLSFYHDIFQIGYGDDLQTNKNRQFWYVGVSIFDALNKLGNLNINLNVPGK